MNITHNQPPIVEATYTYFIHHDGRDYIYQRKETNTEVISQLFDEEKEEWVGYTKQPELISHLDDLFLSQELNELPLTDE